MQKSMNDMMYCSAKQNFTKRNTKKTGKRIKMYMKEANVQLQ